ncbi:MAG TPA: dolichyl-phosphate beta-glucosyltransferase [Armatimonadota bacterium]|jgi:dolichyl-phosphate beta-glucosyltransferase
MPEHQPLVSVVIPAYNESRRLRSGLEQILAHVRATDLDVEIILVDDGSTDNTAEVVRRALEGHVPLRIFRQEPNQGKAAAVRRGILEARGQYVGYADADMSTPFAEIDRFLQALARGADLAIGSRGMSSSDVQVRQPWYRAIAGKAFGFYTRTLLLPGIADSQCGFKFFRREVARDLFSRLQLLGWAFDAELLYLALRLGYKIEQIPVRWINDPDTKVNMLVAGPQMLRDILRIRRLHRTVRPRGS